MLIEADERALGSGRVYRFKHVLIRDVAYSTVPKAERSRLHDRYGGWLEEALGDRKEELTDVVAYHAEQAFRYSWERHARGSNSIVFGLTVLLGLIVTLQSASCSFGARISDAADELLCTPRTGRGQRN